ncbi:MAG: hypothetical protein IRZ11_03380, partial [Clostridia bacterium]|nr:hypothetical protein [Clostridia bacterium]
MTGTGPRAAQPAVLPRQAAIAELRRVGGDGGLVWLEFEEESARRAQPGQFAHILCAEAEASSHPGARRAFGFADLDRRAGRVAIQFRPYGERTRWLAARRPGERLDVLFPLGRGYRLPGDGRPVLLVADVTRPASLLPVARGLAEGAPGRALVVGEPEEAPVVAERLREVGL